MRGADFATEIASDFVVMPKIERAAGGEDACRAKRNNRPRNYSVGDLAGAPHDRWRYQEPRGLCYGRSIEARDGETI
jgi:hypothetical protein